MSNSQLHFGLGSLAKNRWMAFQYGTMMLRSGSKGFHFFETASRLLDSMRNCDFRDIKKVVKIGIFLLTLQLHI